MPFQSREPQKPHGFQQKLGMSCENPLPQRNPSRAALRHSWSCTSVGHVGHHGIPGTDKNRGQQATGWCECWQSVNRKSAHGMLHPAMTYWRDFLVFWSDSLHIFAASQSEVNYPKTKNRKLVVSVVPTHPTKTL